MSGNRTEGLAAAELPALISTLARELERERAARETSERALIEVIDSEHRRLAQLMHDTSSQSLNAARIFARVTRDALQQTRPDAPSALVTLEEVIQTTADEFQDLTHWLRPAKLEGTDLIASLAALCRLAARMVPCEFCCRQTAIDAALDCQAELLRMTQLALHSLVRRRGTESAEREGRLSLELEPDEELLIVQIRASWAHPLPSSLETLLHLRARAMRGTFVLHGLADRGSTLTFRLPKRR